MRQVGFEQGVEIGAGQSPGEGREGQPFAAADLGVDRPRAGAGDGPADAEERAADNRAFVVGFVLEFYGLAGCGSLPQRFN